MMDVDTEGPLSPRVNKKATSHQERGLSIQTQGFKLSQLEAFGSSHAKVPMPH
jgi:hypothetical protein